MEEFENKFINPNENKSEPSASSDETTPDYSAAVKGPETVEQPVYSEPQPTPNSGEYNAQPIYNQQNATQQPYTYAYSYEQSQNSAPEKKKKEKKPRKPISKKGKIALGLVGIFAIGIIGGMVGTAISRGISGRTGSVVVYESEDITSKTGTDSTGENVSGNSVEKVAKETAASVVEVTTSYVQTGSFFGNYVTSGAGSGVIISKDGYIVTNNHVVEDAKDVKVTLKSGKEYTANIIGTDEKTDIAVLKIDAKDLTPAVLGNSDKAVVGENIIVIGNPLGELGGSVTEGIISAKDREVKVENETMTLLQIDAAVNPGNSGGALFNLKGELIGVVNSKYSSEEVEGLGFAIPVNTAKSTIKDIIEYGYVKGRAQLGITAVEISDLQTALSAGVTELGVYVYSVNTNSGADKAGLKSGDRIISVDGKEIASYSALSKILDSHSVGDTVTLKYSRNSQEQTVKVKLIEYNPNTNKENQTTTKQNQNNYSYNFGY